MARLRVSASDIDSFRYFMAAEDSDLDDLLARLRRQSPPTEAMQAGTALHKALETGEPGTLDQIECDGFRFDIAFDGQLDLSPTRETKATHDYQIGGHVVTLVGKVDGIHGRRIEDHKFTSRYDAERFLNSYQWRVYLELFDADKFRWNVFEGREVAERHYTINGFHQLSMSRYPGLTNDVMRELGRYVDFAERHLPEMFVREAA